MAVIALALTALATLAPARAASPASPTSAPDPLGVYFRADAVGANMRSLALSSCGTERWPVKTVTDDDRAKIQLTPTDVSIRNLRSRTEPSTRPQTHRIAPVEMHTFRLRARLVKYVREADGDYHLVLSDARGRTIVAEIPAPGCVGRISPVKAGITLARKRVNAALSVTTTFKSSHRRVSVRGIGFFDFLHGQTGMAPNGIELHPVTALRFR